MSVQRHPKCRLCPVRRELADVRLQGPLSASFPATVAQAAIRSQRRCIACNVSRKPIVLLRSCVGGNDFERAVCRWSIPSPMIIWNGIGFVPRSGSQGLQRFNHQGDTGRIPGALSNLRFGVAGLEGASPMPLTLHRQSTTVPSATFCELPFPQRRGGHPLPVFQ